MANVLGQLGFWPMQIRMLLFLMYVQDFLSAARFWSVKWPIVVCSSCDYRYFLTRQCFRLRWLFLVIESTARIQLEIESSECRTKLESMSNKSYKVESVVFIRFSEHKTRIYQLMTRWRQRYELFSKIVLDKFSIMMPICSMANPI